MRLRVCVFLGAVLMMAACGSSSSGASTPTTPTTVVTTPTTPGSSATGAFDVAAPDPSTGEYGQGKNEAVASFSPASVTVAVGATVTWTNHDNTTHTTTSSTGLWSGNLAPGATFSRAFPTAGTFDFKCTIHPTMSGTIIVK